MTWQLDLLAKIPTLKAGVPIGLAIGAVDAWERGERIDVHRMRHMAHEARAAREAEHGRQLALIAETRQLTASRRSRMPTPAHADHGALQSLLASLKAAAATPTGIIWMDDAPLAATDLEAAREHFREAAMDLWRQRGCRFTNYPAAVDRGRRFGEEFQHNPFQAARALGMTVEHKPSPSAAVLGYYQPAKDGRPPRIVVVDDRGSRGIRAAIVAHELGHHLLGHHGPSTGDPWDRSEIEAEAFAQAFLLGN